MSAYELADDRWHEPDLGNYPIGWAVRELGSIVEVATGKKDVNQGSPNGKYPFFTCARAISWSNTYSFDCEAIMVAGNGDVGNTHYYNGRFEAYQRTYVLSRFSEDADVRFVYAYLDGNLQADLLRAKTGSTMPYIRKGDLVSYRLPFPPLAEQRRIAAVLNTIQDAIAAQEDVIAAAKEFKRSLMHRLFTVGPGREPAPTKETLFGDVPAHWESVVLDRCAEVQTGLAKGRRYRPDEKTVKLPYLRVANVQDGYLDLSEIKTVEIREDEVDRYRLEPGDMLMTEGGDFDKLGRGFVWDGSIANCLHQNHIFAVRADRARLMPEFLAYLAQSAYGKGYFLSVAHRTTNLASINSTKLKALPMLLPALEEQNEVVKMLQVTDAKIAAEEDRLTALQALFKSMLQQLMTGQIRLLSDEGLPLA